VAKFGGLDVVIILLPTVEGMVVQVLLRNMLIVTNAVATMGAVRTSVRKRTTDVPVHARQDINSVELLALVCEYQDLTNVAKFR